MREMTKARMYLAIERGHMETDGYRNLATFNYGDYQNSHKAAFGSLSLFNDETLAGGQLVNYVFKEDCIAGFLPLVGGIECTNDEEASFIIQAGELLLCECSEDMKLRVTNPYSDELVNYIQFRIQAPVSKSCFRFFSFDIQGSKNQLVDVLAGPSSDVNNSLPFDFYLGKFDGRHEATIGVGDNRTGLFAFVIQGAFELQDRLLEARDGVTLWQIKEVEMEALSGEAIVLLLTV